MLLTTKIYIKQQINFDIDKMFIKYILSEQILLSPQLYTQNASKSIRDHIFAKYLFKIAKIPGINNSKSTQAICVKIDNIEIIDNIILRKTADIKIRIQITVLVLRLIPDQYFDGQVIRSDEKGIVVKFLGGLLQGTININNMHKDTLYNQDKNQWIMAAGEQNTQGYQWNVGAKVRFRVAQTFLDRFYEGAQNQGLEMCDLIHLKADEAGLGPTQWWL